ncbi:NAD(P)/FAD-dependent oxidoreductase [Dongia sp.]|uniref:NAD(P)/FAD-dependent oxidoreductase n=1 Tax=Dongia sp. TaxID=1977262 RepID=UPI0035AD81CD
MSNYTARRTPVHRGPAAWNAILPGQDDPIELDSEAKADFVIVGAGFAGLSAARHLLKLAPGAKIVVLEAGRIAEGACARNSGFMIDQPHEIGGQGYEGDGINKNRKQIALNRQAIDFAKANVEDYDIDRNYFDPVGKVNGAAGLQADGLNRDYAKHLSEMGEPSEYLDEKAMQELTGSRYYLSGLYTPGTVMIQPAGYIRGLVRGLRRDGVSIFEHAAAIAIDGEGSGWNVRTARHGIKAGKVILANNGHLESFGFAARRLMHVFLFASMTIDLRDDNLAKLGGEPRWGITPSDPMGTTIRRIDSALGGNRVVTRSCASFRPGMEATQADLDRARRVHRKAFDARFPALRGVPMEFSWAGHLCLSRNGVAVMRELDKNLYSGCVQNGLGTVRGTLTGMGAAELACGVTSDLTRHFTCEDAPTKLPPPPISTIGANLYLRWAELRASRE